MIRQKALFCSQIHIRPGSVASRFRDAKVLFEKPVAIAYLIHMLVFIGFYGRWL